MKADPHIEAREDRLIRRHRSYRGAYIGAVFLLITSIATFLLMLATEGPNSNDVGYVFMTVWLWIFIASYAHAKLDHIQTIQRYRNILTA